MLKLIESYRAETSHPYKLDELEEIADVPDCGSVVLEDSEGNRYLFTTSEWSSIYRIRK